MKQKNFLARHTWEPCAVDVERVLGAAGGGESKAPWPGRGAEGCAVGQSTRLGWRFLRCMIAQSFVVAV